MSQKPLSRVTTIQRRKNFANSFWGEDDRGLEVLIGRLRQAKHICEDVASMLRERASIEEEYGRRLSKLAKLFNPREEIGTLGAALSVCREELESTARSHMNLATDIRATLEKPLVDFIASQSAIRKNHNKTCEADLKSKTNQKALVLKNKQRYEDRCQEVANLQLLAERQGVLPKEAEKVRAKLEKAQSQQKSSDSEYKSSVEKLHDISRKWEDNYRKAGVECQKLEEDRMDFLRTNLWNYANMVSTVCVTDDESCERIRQSLEQCDIEYDIAKFIESNETGSEIPVPLQYTQFFAVGTMSGRSATGTLLSKITRSNSSNTDLSATNQSTIQRSTTLTSSPVTMAASPSGGPFLELTFDDATRKETQKSVASESEYTGIFKTLSNEDGDASLAAAYLAATDDDLYKPKVRPMSAAITQSEMYYQYDPYDIPSDMPVLFNVRALYNYASQEFEELTIKKGDIISVIATHEDGWWEGLSTENGRRKRGLFPSNFVEEIK
ncbi:uncharacterized protein BJ171DRAFT_497978 [Polychytrium aggregatum]|uniref:uncharacterized protein n=1 Tax=Polychytrium aggregatum TaxID=110093 RepID=UPI0022FDBE5D|nr:uncharacterized protein BJ171DRAFT_497978 [Polychytrium aggregatum]KAI9206473.1 hypothetical protein BJ171DRAFT_497978 [Polychytrium aggregatum]